MLHSKDLIAASATPLVLSILKKGDSYGYEIIRQVREASGGEMEWSDGMLYPILHRLEKRALVESYWGQADTGRRRKYYRLCPSGSAVLSDQRKSWELVSELLQKLNGETPCSI
ncbi:MAG: helix-turn-helix transcriptional regulator [Planctomycetes bacterium]|nr:helix-turn-helix transcriptional regulator [Planctomycetota bacterium]